MKIHVKHEPSEHEIYVVIYPEISQESVDKDFEDEISTAESKIGLNGKPDRRLRNGTIPSK